MTIWHGVRALPTIGTVMAIILFVFSFILTISFIAAIVTVIRDRDFSPDSIGGLVAIAAMILLFLIMAFSLIS